MYRKYNYTTDIKNLFKVLYQLRLQNGFYIASLGPEYQYTWLRDNFYCSIPELWNNPEYYIQTYQTWLDYYKDIEGRYTKFSSIINKQVVDHTYEFPHVKLNIDLTELSIGWNHLQLDTLGYFLFGIGTGIEHGLHILRNESDIQVLRNVIDLLGAIKYWSFAECGAWEEQNEVSRLSSIGIILAGLFKIQSCVKVPFELLQKGLSVFMEMFPNETTTRQYDLAQLFLIYPMNLLTGTQKQIILNNIEKNLLRENGVIRYLDDIYYNVNGEAEWSFGFAYLGIIYYQLGDREKAAYYYHKIIANSKDYNIPELYYSGTNTPNDNTPLGWSLALTIELAYLLNK